MTAENPLFSQAPNDLLFSLGRAILFEMDPEKAHDLALGMLSKRPIQQLIGGRYKVAPVNTAVMGQHFENRVGLAAGLDKNADYIDALGAIGFGHIEVGTITPKAQAGNPKPRIFRLAQHQALINRLGFNNKGVDYLVKQVQGRQYRGRLGINIGKNAATDLEHAQDDYLYCLKRVYAFADYITINISSPNTQGLRDLQHGRHLQSLLDSIKNSQSQLATEHERYVPIAVKIAPDMTEAELDELCTQVLAFEIDALISGNTTNTREPVASHLYARETGGLSGKPLRALADEKLASVHKRIGSKAALFGVGGISRGNDALHKLQAGADLVQLYSGLIFQGPALVRDCIEATRDF